MTLIPSTAASSPRRPPRRGASMRSLSHLALLSLAAATVEAIDAGASFQVPYMGYNTYNDVACAPTASHVNATLDALVSRGLLNLGYRYFQIDCGWQAKQRDSTTGSMIIDTTAFPNGLAGLSARAKSLGFRWSMYSDAGLRACDTTVPSVRPGSLGYEKVDAQFFLSLGTELLKYDNCYASGTASSNNAPKNPDSTLISRYAAMRMAIDQLGARNTLALTVCQWGVPYPSTNGTLGPSQWAGQYASAYRLSDDIYRGWANVLRIINESIHIALAGRSGPGAYADADLLEVGNSGMTWDEQSSHFAYWAMLRSPLMISTNVVNLSADTLRILGNQRLIAINQDTSGRPIKLVQRWTNDRDLFAAELANGDLAVLLLDTSNTNRTLTLELSRLGLSSATVLDLWAGTQTSGVQGTYSKQVGAHGNLALRLSQLVRSGAAASAAYRDVRTAVFTGQAQLGSCSGCSSGQKTVNLYPGSSFTLTNLTSPRDGLLTVRFDYVNAQIGFGQDLNTRMASVSVNGGTPVDVLFPVSGYDWVRDVAKDFLVDLNGFRKGVGNSITVAALAARQTTAGPDFDRIGLPTS